MNICPSQHTDRYRPDETGLELPPTPDADREKSRPVPVSTESAERATAASPVPDPRELELVSDPLFLRAGLMSFSSLSDEDGEVRPPRRSMSHERLESSLPDDFLSLFSVDLE